MSEIRIICKFWVVLLILGATSATIAKAQTIAPSPDTQVSLLTAAPGDQLYSLFGHTALRIYDPKTGFDRTYNYGTFDFNTERFYWKFALGHLQYFLSTAPFKTAKQAYLADGRAVTEQRLNLSPEQTNRLFRYLQANSKPENRYYSYEFFYDNCTTRVYDAIKNATGDALQFQKPLNREKQSYRQLINTYLQPVPWVKLGINLLLGIPADRIPNGLQTLFLPNLLKNRFAHAQIQTVDRAIPLVRNQTIYSPPHKAVLNPPLLTPGLVFWSLLALVLPLGIGFAGEQSFWRWFDRILFSVVGALGFLILFLWLFSAYPTTKWNANIVWTLLAPAILIGVIHAKHRLSRSRNLIKLITLAAALIAMTFFLIHQQIPAALYPVLVLLIFRGWIYFLMTKQKYATILQVKHK